MPRRGATFLYRRQHPELFPYYCGSCVPQRRFKLPRAKAQHDKDKHGIPIPTLSQEPVFSAFSFQPPQMISSTSLSPLSSVTARKINSIVRTQPGPDTQYNDRRQQGFIHNFGHPSPMSTSAASTRPLREVPADQLNSFVQNEVEPDTEYNDRCNEVVDRLCKFLQNNFPGDLRPSEVRKCGSLGKGTAVRGRSDADLVVFLNRYDSVPKLSQNLSDILDKMRMHLQTSGNCEVTGTTPHAVQVTVQCHRHSHDVDILPSANILKSRPLKDIYAEMNSASSDSFHCYSAALAPVQVEFVSKVPTKVKTLIRLMKYWRKTDLEKNAGDRQLPSSYPLELIVIGKWNQARSPENFDLRKGLFHVLTAIANYREIKLDWTENYPSHHCSDDFYVMDPANPYNNVMRNCKCWDFVADKAREFLGKAQMFKALPLNLPGFGWL